MSIRQQCLTQCLTQNQTQSLVLYKKDFTGVYYLFKTNINNHKFNLLLKNPSKLPKWLHGIPLITPTLLTEWGNDCRV